MRADVAWVNADPRELADPSLTSTIIAACTRHGNALTSLELEIADNRFVRAGTTIRLTSCGKAGTLVDRRLRDRALVISRLSDVEVGVVKASSP